ncbi:MAG: DUF885 family protein [Pseudomonadota bacterium]|nr:DUF885 family protein [Pseudomonadota bacterium]
MSVFNLRVSCGIVLFALSGCGAAPSPPTAAAHKSMPPGEQLSRLVERYWDEHVTPENQISPQLLADSLSIERRYLAEVDGVERESLDAAARLTYDIFKRQRELLIEGFTYPSELLPLDPFWGTPQRFAARAERLAQQPRANAADYESWLKSMDEYVRWTQQATLNMREGVRRGYRTSRVLIERMLPILERLGLDQSANVFYAPLRAMSDTIKEPERGPLTRELSGAISQKLLPANRALHDFLQKEYLPRARAGIALSELPLGAQWYAFRVKRATGTLLSPEEINRLGVAEVDRIGAPRSASAAAASVPAELVGAYKELKIQVLTAMPVVFSELPKEDFDIRSAEWLPMLAGALYYQRAGLDVPAVLYVNAGRGAQAVSIASFLQQALPGHHLQLALQQEHADLPRFRRFGSEPAFTQGWGIYAATLGDALRLDSDESAKSGATAAEMRCAAALVVDTGVHAKGWTRRQGIEYLRAHLEIDERDAQELIDNYAANPADALACMMGGLKFRALRTQAQQSLGGRFDVREFHHEILRDGAMPLDILEAKMKTWTGASR